MLKQHDRSLRLLLLITDVALCCAVFAVCLLWRGQPVTDWALLAAPSWLALGLIASLALPVTVRALEGTVTRFESLLDTGRNLAIAAATGGVILAALAFLLAAPLAPKVLLETVSGQLFAVGLLRLSIRGSLRGLRRHGRNYRNVVVLGTGPRAREFTDTVERHPEWGLRLLCYVDESDCPVDASITGEIFKLVDFPAILRDQIVDEVIAACPRSMLSQIGPAVQACSAAGVPLTLMTDLFGDYLPPPQVKHLGSRATLSFVPVHHGAAQLAAKRTIDIAGAAVGLAITAPVLVLAALAIKLTSQGPVFFQQTRCGLYGRPFGIYKLRTMVCDAEARQSEILHLNEMDGPVFKVRQDPRIHPVGRVLRAFSIDELPQLWNVLVGDMSLVGPRPPIPAEVAQYETCERRRLSMRPGLTCLWQVSGGRNTIPFDEWVKLDLDYIDSWSLGRDLKILLFTVPVVLSGTGR